MEYFSAGSGLVLWSSLLFLAGCGTVLALRFSKKKDYAGQAIVPTAMIALSLLLWAITFSFPSEEAGPAVVPRLWIFWSVLLAGILLLFCFTGRTDKDPGSGRLGFLLTGVILTIGYFFSIEILGYFISSFLFLALLMYLLSYRKPLVVFLVCSGWVLFSYIIFYKLLYIQLPLGFIENFMYQ